jgi:hypothetical protein
MASGAIKIRGSNDNGGLSRRRREPVKTKLRREDFDKLLSFSFLCALRFQREIIYCVLVINPPLSGFYPILSVSKYFSGSMDGAGNAGVGLGRIGSTHDNCG